MHGLPAIGATALARFPSSLRTGSATAPTGHWWGARLHRMAVSLRLLMRLRSRRRAATHRGWQA